MFYAIEIPDSDDDMPEPGTAKVKCATSSSEASEPTPEKRRKTSPSSTTADGAKAKSSESLSSDTTASPPTSSASAHQARTQGRHRSRKTQHTVRNAAETEIQFESILLDVDTKEQQSNPGLPAAAAPAELRLPESDTLKETICQILDSDEMQKIIQRIANERVRCNFLLATYHLPDMNFTLNTHLDTLKFQFRERLRQRKER
ncbi:hypothetical protein KR222_007351, partial [Zaprionus bogoriensis]